MLTDAAQDGDYYCCVYDCASCHRYVHCHPTVLLLLCICCAVPVLGLSALQTLLLVSIQVLVCGLALRIVSVERLSNNSMAL